MSIDADINSIRTQFLQELTKATEIRDIEALQVRFLGKKGLVAGLMLNLKNCSKDTRPLIGKLINDLKLEITSHCDNSHKRMTIEAMESQLEKEKIDVTIPGRKKFLSSIHPISQVMKKMVDILIGMGFSVELGPDLESDFYNFEGLNFEKDHPARDMQDTFYITKDLLLRTHTSNVQVRVMESQTPPIRVIAPGRCFRNENISSRSHMLFHQIEGFYIDKKVTFGDLLATLDEFWKKLFGKKIETRYRPSYFPFVEPGLEGDIKCLVCSGKGCRLCKYSGWLEVVGAGMIHPEVLKSGGIDPEEYQGYAWGVGIERIAMLQHSVKDIRLFTENDKRFLKQFQ
jgi:phenylalanyl-tRNA synthetase alpha chain